MVTMTFFMPLGTFKAPVPSARIACAGDSVVVTYASTVCPLLTASVNRPLVGGGVLGTPGGGCRYRYGGTFILTVSNRGGVRGGATSQTRARPANPANRYLTAPTRSLYQP